MSEDDNNNEGRNAIKIEDATVTGTSLSDDSEPKKEKKSKKAKKEKKSKSKVDDEVLGATSEQRKHPARKVAVVTGGLNAEQSSIPGSDATTDVDSARVEGGFLTGKKIKTSQVVLDPRLLREQPRKQFYAENEINPSAPPSAFNQAIDVRKIGRKDSYVEGEVNPTAPPSPV